MGDLFGKREPVFMVITLIAALFAFGIMIAFHEFGHFVCAKLSGIRVNEFSIGMGPAVWKTVRKGTQYSIRALPIGGYVAMEGEDSAESDLAEKAAEEREAAPEDAAAGKPFNEASIPRRFLTIAAGACMNFVLAYLVLLYLVGSSDAITSKVIYTFKTEDALCAQTGLREKDEILAVNGFKCYVADDIIYELSRTPDYAADFTVRRDGEVLELKNVQFDTWQDEANETHMAINFIVYGLQKTPLRVIQEAFNYERYYGRVVFLSLSDLVRGRGSINDLSGPVGIVTAIGEAAKYGLEDFLTLLALLSVNLGIMNLLPLPALDGGKLVFLVWEGVTGKPVPSKVQEWSSLVGFGLLFALMLFATFNDVLRLAAGG